MRTSDQMKESNIKTKVILDQKVIDLERWGRLLKTDEFQVIYDLINNSLDSLRKKIEEKNVKPSPERAYELIDYTGRIAELKKLLARIDFNKQQFLKNEKEK